eukprot:CAMPEP_0197823072 /NCGR_PEP_ID=MMETSP1437-20131217/397_1 /TAXON_ID=49252 ORGANISM="Eucampia antarctica, Strain CCMP1452" /NCGR_SAMPLE_ID=MMETSP1437 /ASSEMBLY_ACC=CAM_ASM_001096 /LENGTH=879 /DNA_ID=CAMNT_0043422043 /DNA_START=47 /DNA_END=2686 /DNA_ORIENTATION=-
MTDVTLEELKAKVEALGEKVKTLKSSSEVDKDAIGAAVKELMESKLMYAEKNNGIGVDGKPYEAPMSKAEKKKKAKADKAKEAEASGKKETSNTANAAKKAAKKAEGKAKKAALKDTGGKPAAKTVVPVRQNIGNKSTLGSSSRNKLQPLQLSFNPNVPLTERPVVALSVAILTNTALDVNIVSDHQRHNGPGLGLPNGGEVLGDLAAARYLARRPEAAPAGGLSLLGGDDASSLAFVDQWVDYASSISRFPLSQKVAAVSATLDTALASATYLCGNILSLADLALYAALGFPTQLHLKKEILKLIVSDQAPIFRWVNMMSSNPALRTATQLAVEISNSMEAVFDSGVELDPLMDGMSPLIGATPGNVVTRFPPEPSGYLHIGHAKAVLMNEYYARRYKGRLIVRFDDTNPDKEKEEFQSSILEDLGKLGVVPDVVTHTSDYFPTICAYAKFLIDNGLAFMDDTPQEQMQKERMDLQNSQHRDQSVQDAHKFFVLMSSGKEDGAAWCLRAKIDMQSVNGTMRDPVIFRQNTTPHHRSGTTYKSYPTYDLACPIVDSIEGVTHALRTTEYDDRNEQYQWFQATLGLRRVRIQSFARMNFMHTILSKRHLSWFVSENLVTGWDDARFPTVRGVGRRGINIDALRQFMCSQGASRRIVNMEWNKFWAENKKFIDKTAKRFMAIDKENSVLLKITNAPTKEDNSYVLTPYLPKDPSFGSRVIRLANEVLLEKVDTDGIGVGENIVLMRWGVVKITSIENGLEGVHVPDGDIKAAKRKLTWMANVENNVQVTLTEFDNLISKGKIEEGESFKDFLNPNTLATSTVTADPSLMTLQQHEIIQLERRGYYRVDQPYMNSDKPLVLYMIPDGKAKAMSGLTGKLAHR